MDKKNIKLYLIPFIAVAVFSLLLFGAGYAYFNSTLTMNSANYSINMPLTTSLVCTKQDCNVTITPDMMTNTNTNATVPKGTSNCSVSCTCSGTPGAVCAYDVKLLESGTPYTPSSGLGNDKEFTVKVTSQSGCTAQNSSGTETQVNTLRNKVVSSCSLTVPAGGNVTSNVYAEFKWYNLNLDQTSHALKVYNYQLTNDDGNSSSSGFTGTIYRQTSDSISIGESIVPTTSAEYYLVYIEDATDVYEPDTYHFSSLADCEALRNTDPYGEFEFYECNHLVTGGLQHGYQTTGLSGVYLKHDIVNNIVQTSNVCSKNNSVETCFKYGDPYGTYDGMSSTKVHTVSNATGNIQKLHNLNYEQSWAEIITTNYSNMPYEDDCMLEEFGEPPYGYTVCALNDTCSYNNTNSYCISPDSVDHYNHYIGLMISLKSNGSISIMRDNEEGCHILSSGKSYCEYYNY